MSRSRIILSILVTCLALAWPSRAQDEAGDRFKQVSRFEMGQDPCHSSIIAAHGRLLVRTADNLYCIKE